MIVELLYSKCVTSDETSLGFFSLKETEEPVVECQECETDASSSRTAVGSSLTSGDLGDVSSFSSKASSLHRTSSAASSGHSATHSSSSSSGRGTGAAKGKVCGTGTGEFALPVGRGVLGKLRYVQSLGKEEQIFYRSEQLAWGECETG